MKLLLDTYGSRVRPWFMVWMTRQLSESGKIRTDSQQTNEQPNQTDYTVRNSRVLQDNADTFNIPLTIIANMAADRVRVRVCIQIH